VSSLMERIFGGGFGATVDAPLGLAADPAWLAAVTVQVYEPGVAAVIELARISGRRTARVRRHMRVRSPPQQPDGYIRWYRGLPAR
jgi:hypothetical protein